MKSQKRRLTLQTRMILLITVLIVGIVGAIGMIFSSMFAASIEEQIGKRALNVAKIVATMPQVRGAFQTSNPSAILQPIAENVRIQTEAEFVVVGDKRGIRYAHPLPERIGKAMVGGDNELALQYGQSYVSKAVGSLGPSLRGKVPIFDDKGQVVGIVSVGFLLEDIDQAIASYRAKVLGVVLVSVVVGIAGAIWLSNRFKRAIFGLEPEEIATMFEERNAILESVREGIVAIDQLGRVTMANKAAVNILNLPHEGSLLKKPIAELIPDTKMLDVLKTGEQQLDRESTIAGKEILVNRIPIKVGEKVIGVVSSFRPKSELDRLMEELSQARRYADALRAQTHEFHNLLYTISGLMQLGSIQEAIELITRETSSQQEMILFIARSFPDPLIGALLLGMHNRAKELKIDFLIHPDSRLNQLPPEMDRQQIIILLGNLIQNAFEAITEARSPVKRVECYLSDAGSELLFEVEDSGPGVADALREQIFHYGFSTKPGDGRGIGLAKVKSMVEEMGGYILVGSSELGGALFTVSIPKGKERTHETAGSTDRGR
ncbi:sensor histidine kinase [Brevibacillus sp. SYP-B805]|uniref:ATP-binding protein n=1 Tax=Brevibacillus sp. SYP-B805 TaxID=1578199 RepID=UPI0013EB876D|nr:sensor histidine kinase [Brevibacillus sp. SYP-B805]NGQ96286.1 sensor histidine kinase [Brevibacillus sp. SYP-B805]